MKGKRKAILQRGIMVAVSALTVVASAGTVMAYEPIASSDASFNDIIFDDSYSDFSNDYTEMDIIDSLDFTETDNIFVGSDNIQIACQETVSPRALCTHSMVPGKFYAHAKNSSGGCTLKVYTCQRCEKCGYRANAKYQNTITFAVCPH